MLLGTDWLTNVASSFGTLGLLANVVPLLAKSSPTIAKRVSWVSCTGAKVQQQVHQFLLETQLPNECEEQFLCRAVSRGGWSVCKNAKRAGEGNRTLVCSLGSCHSTIELHPPKELQIVDFRFAIAS